MNIEKGINQIAKAQKTLDVVMYVYRSADNADKTDIMEIKLGIAQAERYLKVAKAIIGDE